MMTAVCPAVNGLIQYNAVYDGSIYYSAVCDGLIQYSVWVNSVL